MPDASGDTDLDAETRSKDEFFRRIGELTDEMSAAHGRDFAIGTLVLAARFLAQGKPLSTLAQAQAQAAPN